MKRKRKKNGFDHIDFNDALRGFKKRRITKLVRVSGESHSKIKALAKERKTTMSKTLDFIIKKFFKHQNLYENDRRTI